MEKKVGMIPQLPEGARAARRNEEAPKHLDENGPIDVDPGDLVEVDADGQEIVTQKETAQQDTETAYSEAEAAWKERVEEWEASRNHDVIGETLTEAQAAVARAEKSTATKIGKALRTLGEGLRIAGTTIAAAYTHLREGAENLAHDTSDAVLGTRATDRMKGFWGNMFGRQNAEIRTNPVDQHRGIREMGSMEVTSMKELWDALWQIPSDIGRRLDEWSPEAMQESSELAREIEARAWETRNTVLGTLEAEEKALRAQELSDEAFAEAMQNIQDRRDVADDDYNDEVQKANDLTPSIPGAAVKGAVWWATRGIPQSFWAATPDVIDYFALNGLVKEMGQDFARGVRQERRRSFEQANPGVPYSQDMITSWGPQERAMGVMERLGETLAGIAESMRESRDEHQEAVVEEVKNAQRGESGIYQDAVSTRIEALTEKTKMTAADRAEIGYLTVKLARVRSGEIGAEELDGLVQRAEAFARSAESKRDDEKLLLGYIAGRAINTIRSLSIMEGRAGDHMIHVLQKEPSVKNLKRAEALVLAHVERELRPASEDLLTAEHKAKLLQAREALKDSVARATELYTSSLTRATTDITKGIQAANRDMKKAAAQAEAARVDEQMAAK